MKSLNYIYSATLRAVMVSLQGIAGLIILGGGVAVVMWSSGKWTPIIDRVAGVVTSEIGTATAGNGGGNGW